LFPSHDHCGGKNDDERIDYKVQTKKSYAGDDVEEVHESFGMIRFSRVQGSKRLFGSQIDEHPSYIMGTITRCKRIHSDLGYDRYIPEGRRDIVEFSLSASQFAEAITNISNGFGVPCTLDVVNRVRMEPLPDEVVSERQIIVDRFNEEMADFMKSVQPKVDRINEILAKKSVNKSDRSEIGSLVSRILMVMSDHAPFMLKQFNESIEKFETSAKHEVESFMDLLMKAHSESLGSSVNLGVREVPAIDVTESDG
jgi:hypothetical protein